MQTSNPIAEKVTELISLINIYLDSRPDSIDSYPDVHEALGKLAEHTLLQPGVPVSLQVFPQVSITSHLDDSEAEKQAVKEVVNRIGALVRDAEVNAAAKSVIQDEYERLASPMEVLEDVKGKDLLVMMAQLRRKQRFEKDAAARRNEQRGATQGRGKFRITVVKGVHPDGMVSDLGTCDIDPRSSWAQSKETLDAMRREWRVHSDGHETMSEGKWLYHALSAANLPEKEAHDLDSWEDYHDMRSKLDSGEHLAVLIWDAEMWREAMTKNTEAGAVETDDAREHGELVGEVDDDGWRDAVFEDFTGKMRWWNGNEI